MIFEIFQNQLINLFETSFISKLSFFDIGLNTLRRLPDNSSLSRKITVYFPNLSRIYAV